MNDSETMHITIPYNRATLEVQLPRERVLAVVEPNEVTAEGTPQQIIRQAIDHPSGDQRFSEFINSEGSLLVIVNDGTRPTPTRYVLEVIGDDLERVGAEFIVATGVHRAPTPEEFTYIFGDQYERFAGRIHVHDARKQEDMVFLGTSSNGTPMYVNRLGVEADKILVIGSVEPHYFAGYTGGRKGFLPGIASYESIEKNHEHALEPGAQALALEGNPVHEDMVDALKVVDNQLFSIMSVLDKHQHIYQVTAGDIHTAFEDAIEKADQVFAAEIPRKADIVVTVAKYPMDVDLYQAQKAIDNAKLALKPGGTMILVAACREGLGEQAFVDLLSSYESPEEVLEHIKGTYKLGYHKAGKMAEIFQRASVCALTELEDSSLEQIFISPVHSLADRITQALEEHGASAEVLFLLDGCVTVPQIR
ncbi:MAG: nickel-dependent lactate racemase [Spirochaetota bacterium]